jgi:hypothetical protein
MSPPEDFPFFVSSAKHSISDKFQNPTAFSSPVIRTAVQHGIQHWNVGYVELRSLEKEACSEGVNEVIWIENSAQGVSEE